MGLVCDLRQFEQIIPTERAGGAPGFAIMEASLKGNVVQNTLAGGIRPNSGLDQADSDFVDGTVLKGF
jgi:hypothetical protein